MKISVDVGINKPKELVWTAITDIENSTKMITGIIDLMVLEINRVRSQYLPI